MLHDMKSHGKNTNDHRKRKYLQSVFRARAKVDCEGFLKQLTEETEQGMHVPTVWVLCLGPLDLQPAPALPKCPLSPIRQTGPNVIPKRRLCQAGESILRQPLTSRVMNAIFCPRFGGD